MADSAWWRRLTTLERCLTVITFYIILSCTVLAIGIGVIMANRIWCDPKSLLLFNGDATKGITIPKNICYSSTCVHAASTILRNMNESMNPCDNFYNFACGNFIAETLIPEDKGSITAVDGILERVQQQLRNSIEKPIISGESKFIRLIKNLYKSCMDMDTIKRKGRKEFLTMLKELGGWPVLEGNNWKEDDFNWIESVYKFRDVGLSTNYFIGFRVTIDSKNNTRRIIDLDQPSFGIARGYLVGGVDSKILRAYHKYMIDIAVLLGASLEAAIKELTVALEFERLLAKVSLSDENRRAVTRLYNPISLNGLSFKCPSIPWKEYLNRLLAPNVSVDDDEIINVEVPGYILNFEKIIQVTPRRTQANYVMWRVVAESIGYLSEELRGRELGYATETSGVTAREPRWQECIRIVSNKLSVGVSSLYVRRHFTDDTKKTASQMFLDIKNEMNRTLQWVHWMDNLTKANALHKCSKMVTHIGYPDELLDDEKLDELYEELELSGDSFFKGILNVTRYYSDISIGKLRTPVARSEWKNYGSSAQVNAYYTGSDNSVDVKAAILQGHIFNSKHPKYINFGGIGVIIGHEITHGFDDYGRYYDQNGNVVNWWTRSSELRFEREVECMINQYSNFTSSELGLHLNGQATRNENIADNGGIKLAYAAYKKWASTHRKEQSLPGLAYTSQQMFWISAANLWCAKYRPQYLEYQMTQAVHSPAKYRVLGPFSNMVDFAKDFKCAKGTKMNPEHKCEIW